MTFSDARRPTLQVLVNGVPANGAFEIDVQSTNFYASDRYAVRAALSADPPELWSEVPLLIEIGVGLDGTTNSVMLGKADSISIDPVRGEVRVAGRDLASDFIATQLEESFENQTSSEIATVLAQRRGLVADVSPTSTLIGRYYQTGHTRTALTQHARATTEWELLTWLAQLENCDIWVTGQTLHFQPVDQPEPVLTISPSDCMTMHLHRALDIAAGVSVSVKSWGSASQTTIMGSASSATFAGAGIMRTIVRPNLSATDAQDLAERVLGQISAHERVVTFDMPGDLTTVPRAVVALADTGTDFDGLYTICSVDRHLSYRRGFTQTVEARNLPWTLF